MSASFTWYKTSCFDITFKRGNAEGVPCTCPREVADLAACNCRHRDQALMRPLVLRALLQQRKRDQTHLTLTGFSQTKPTFALPVENQALTALSIPTGAPDLTSKVKKTLPLPVPQTQAVLVALLPVTTSHGREIPCLHGAMGGVRKPVSAPPTMRPSCASSPSSATPAPCPAMAGRSKPHGGTRRRPWHALLPYAAPGPWLLLSIPASLRLCQQAEPFSQGPTKLPAGTGSSPSPSSLRLPSLFPASPPLSRLLPWGVSQQLGN